METIVVVLCWVLVGWVMISAGALIAAVAATRSHFRTTAVDEDSGSILPMTLIKPIRGLDEGLRENLESIAAADAGRRLQTIIAIESEEDPAWNVARDFAGAHPERDILLLQTGPHGDRMGKIHNMIEAFPKAKHPYLIFSDADVRTTSELLTQTSRAFREGFDAVYALPYHRRGLGLGGMLLQGALNHSFAVFAALSYRLNDFRFYAGAWMAYRKEVLDRLGGLESFAHEIADDYALGTAASNLGARKRLLPVPAYLSETTRSLSEACEHLAKWSSIIQSCLPGLYCLVPLMDAILMSALLVGLCAAAGRGTEAAGALLAAVAILRMAAAVLQDHILRAPALPWFGYVLLPLTPLVSLPLWFSGFRSTITWRGTRYRLARGGRATVLKNR